MSASITRPFLLIKSALSEPIWLAVAVSASLHAGAIAWMIASDPAPREVKIAGGQVVIEVAIVEGPERHPGADTGVDRDRPSTPSAPARAATQPDRHKAADRVSDPPVDRADDRHAAESETTSPDNLAAAAHRLEPPLPATPSNSMAVALMRAPPPPPAKPKPPAPTKAAVPSTPQKLPKPQSDAADGKNARTAPGRDGVETPADDSAHRGGTKGASPRGDNPKPEYPFAARKSGYQGRVILRVDVSPNGTADNVELRSSSGYDSLDAAALRTVRQWRFVPGRRHGQPVAAVVTVPVLFKLY